LSIMYDLVIIGGGPGGVAAGVYAARKRIKSVLITDRFGGQSLVSAEVKNWIGSKSISGLELAQILEGHLRDQAGIEIIDSDQVVSIREKEGGFEVGTDKGKTLSTKNILLASGSRRRKLGIPGEEKHEGRGVAYCSICDAPLFNDKVVAVIGGGNAGLEAVVDLEPYASKIYLLERSDSLRGDPITQEKIKKNSNVEIFFNTETLEILGDSGVTGLKYRNNKTNEEAELDVRGVFVEIGIIPNSEIVKDLVDINEFGEVVVDHKTQLSSRPGIWAVGDVSDVLYKQNNISAGDAIKAVLNIYDQLMKKH